MASPVKTFENNQFLRCTIGAIILRREVTEYAKALCADVKTDEYSVENAKTGASFLVSKGSGSSLSLSLPNQAQSAIVPVKTMIAVPPAVEVAKKIWANIRKIGELMPLTLRYLVKIIVLDVEKKLNAPCNESQLRQLTKNVMIEHLIFQALYNPIESDLLHDCVVPEDYSNISHRTTDVLRNLWLGKVFPPGSPLSPANEFIKSSQYFPYFNAR